MFNKYPEGYDLTILDTRYRYPRLGENGKYDKGSITLVAKDNTTGKKIIETISNPVYTYYVIKDEVLVARGIDYPLKEIEASCVDPVTVPYCELEKDIAERIGETEFYYSNLKNKMRAANALLHIENPKIMASDMNIEDYYRFLFSQKFKNTITKPTKAFFDIEADTINMKGDFPEPGECPINAVTLINQENKTVYVLFLENAENELIAEFEQELKNGTIVPEFKKLLLEHVGGVEGIKKFGLDEFKYNFASYDTEINLIADLFNIINILQPDFVLAWNMAFDIPYIIQRIINLGYKPEDIMCHPDFKYKEARYWIDPRNEELAERGDFATISSYSVFLDQMIQHASIRKGQSRYLSYSLDFVTNLICNFGKLDYHSITPYLSELPYKDFKTFIFYNIMDVIDQVAIENKVNDIDFTFTKALSNNTRYSKVHRQSVYLINRRFAEYYKAGYISGNNVNKANKKPDEKFAGAFVADPLMINDKPKIKINGVPAMLFNNLDDYDYRRLYPTMLQEFNVSAGTQIGKIQIPERVHDKEDLSDASKFYDRSGAFCDDIAVRNSIEFCSRWFGLANFGEMVDDIEEFFTLERSPMNFIPFINETGGHKLFTISNPKVQPLFRFITKPNKIESMPNSITGELYDVYNNNIGFKIK